MTIYRTKCRRRTSKPRKPRKFTTIFIIEKQIDKYFYIINIEVSINEKAG